MEIEKKIVEVVTEKSLTEKFILDLIAKAQELLPIVAAKLVFLIIIFFLWPKLIAVVLKICERMGKKDKVDPLLVSFLKSLTKTIMYIILFFIVINTLGVQATSFMTILGTAGLAVGLALQGSLTNLASGMIILFFKNISKGDYISANNGVIEGTVTSIHILYTRITMADGLAMLVPNSQLANAVVINVSKNPERRLDLIYSTSYDNSIDKTLKVLQQVVDEETKIIKNVEDRPIVLSLIKHNASSLDYRFRVWVKKEDYFEVMYRCNRRVKELFDENGIEIPYNKLDVYNKS